MDRKLEILNKKLEFRKYLDPTISSKSYDMRATELNAHYDLAENSISTFLLSG